MSRRNTSGYVKGGPKGSGIRPTRPKKPKLKEVAGPYRDESSNPDIRSDATPREHRKLPVSPSKAATTNTPQNASAEFQRPPTLSPPLLVREIEDLLTPGPTAREVAGAGQRLGVNKPQGKSADPISKLIKGLGSTADAALEQIAEGVEDASQGAKAAVKTVARLPRQSAKEALGVNTLGSPTVAQVVQAARKGKTQLNKRGKLTIPATRKAARRLHNLREKKARIGGPLPGLDPHQTQVVRTVLRQGDRLGATWKEKLAAVETALVETDARNLGHGDRDSEGWRQERSSFAQYPNPRNVKASARRFFEESISDTGGSRGAGMTAGELAQTIQASAFPERYDERRGEALGILRAYEQGGEASPELADKLRAAEAQAERLGIPTQPQNRLEPLPKQVLSRFKAAATAASELDRLKLPYVWGGGHGDPASRPTGGGLDCSGAVGYVLNKMGAMKGSLVSGEFGQVLEPGPGAVTVFYNPGHVFMKIGKRYWGTSRTNPEGGPGFIEGTPDDLSKYNVGHVPGMGKKVAVQMGVHVGGGGFPGVEMSPDGTTATVAPAAGTKQDKPAFSDKPILPSAPPATSPLLATSAPLPEAFSQFQLGEEPGLEQGDGDSIIESILRSGRV